MLTGFIGFTGLQNLLTDASKVLMILAPFVTAAFIGWFALERSQSDEMDQKAWTKRIKTALFSGVIVEVASSLVTVVFSYFIV